MNMIVLFSVGFKAILLCLLMNPGGLFASLQTCCVCHQVIAQSHFFSNRVKDTLIFFHPHCFESLSDAGAHPDHRHDSPGSDAEASLPNRASYTSPLPEDTQEIFNRLDIIIGRSAEDNKNYPEIVSTPEEVTAARKMLLTLKEKALKSAQEGSMDSAGDLEQPLDLSVQTGLKSSEYFHGYDSETGL